MPSFFTIGVKSLFLLTFCWVLGLSFNLYGDIRITAEVANNTIYENSPVEILVMINHNSDEIVDINSFEVEKNNVKAELQKEEIMSASTNRLLSIYKISLPPQPKGAHLLPSVSVLVGGKKYKSIASTYEVSQAPTESPPAVAKPKSQTPQSAVNPQAPTAAAPVKQGATLQLKPFVEGPSEIYPGQKITVGYRYMYNVSLDTTEEKVPLLEATGLIKVGAQATKQAQQGDFSILEISQIVQGDKPGTYSFGPSILEGLPYQLAAGGQKIYAKEKLSSVAEPVVITVKPFPQAEQPASFTGAAGNFSWDVQLLSPSTIQVGDAVQLAISATGDGNLENLALPDLCCQPGMAGLFRLSDVPSAGKVEGTKKTFTVEMRALSEEIKEIPSFEFSSFDPETAKFVVTKSSPIPIVVSSIANTEPSALQEKIEDKETLDSSQWKEEIENVSALEIEGFSHLTAKNLENKTLGTWWSLLLIPFSIGFLMFQNNLMKYVEETKKLKSTEAKSFDFFAAAKKASKNSSEQYELWKKALLLRLQETGKIESAEINPQELPEQGIAGNVKIFLLQQEESRYSGLALPNENPWQSQAEHLFNSIL